MASPASPLAATHGLRACPGLFAGVLHAAEAAVVVQALASNAVPREALAAALVAYLGRRGGAWHGTVPLSCAVVPW